MFAETPTVLAAQTPPGSVAAPWWLSFGVLVYGALLVAAFMIYAQTRHERPWSVIWVLVIAFIPILGAIIYFIAQTLHYRRSAKNPETGPG
ncbi:PLD nuclease N-terminal domain-containing protein [Nesterenkonia ebinurensis]|uniref:PLD nuclease N-terminal domain-containing protein n=1 Tax=Nesterenkonia ebinurensis TaxID=2608252 RepID=UPI00123D7076|nr:PLD nuclease N-terminal domain-containing protein [Nesterenkonia ebinurensis]